MHTHTRTHTLITYFLKKEGDCAFFLDEYRGILQALSFVFVSEVFIYPLDHARLLHLVSHLHVVRWLVRRSEHIFAV